MKTPKRQKCVTETCFIQREKEILTLRLWTRGGTSQMLRKSEALWKTGPDWQLTLNSDAAPPHLWQAQVSTSTSYILRNDTIGYYLQNTSDDDEEQEAHQSRVSSAERGRRSSWLEDTGSFHRPSLKRPAPSSLGVEEWTQVLYRITTLVCNGITFY